MKRALLASMMAALLIGGAAIARVETVGPSGYLRPGAFDLLAAARAELDALRHDPATARADADICAQEAALIAQRIF